MRAATGGMADRRDRIASHLGLIGFALVCGLGWAVLAVSDAALPVVLPILAMLAVIGVAVIVLWDRRAGTPSLFEIGTVYMAVVGVYTLFPLLGFLVNGLRYTPFNDSRLFAAQPRPEDLGVVAWYHVAHAASFLVGYVLVRGRRTGEGVRSPRVSRPTLVAAVFLYVAIVGFFTFLRLLFDLSSTTYIESFLVTRRLPLILAQLVNHLEGVLFPLELVLLAALFADYRRYRLLIGGWLVMLGMSTFGQLWSRTALMHLLLAVVLMYHRAVRPIRVGMLGVIVVLALASFNWLGTLRAGVFDSSDAATVNPIFGYSSEFEVIFANAYDLKRRLRDVEAPDPPASIYFSEVLALIPQQVSPFIKVDPGAWYANTFYPAYAEAGGAFAFGAIAQAVLGGGWTPLVARGVMLGLLLGLLHRYWVRHATNTWAFICYIWATVLVYQSFRNVAFSLLALFVYRFVPAWLLVKVLSAVWMKKPRVARPRTRSSVASL
jgi:hypothetical protein